MALAMVFAVAQAASVQREAEAKNPTDVFCPVFRKQCDKLAKGLSQGREKVRTRNYCRRNGGKYSSYFTFYCKINGDDYTQDVLDAVSSGEEPSASATTSAVTSTTAPVVTPTGNVVNVIPRSANEANIPTIDVYIPRMKYANRKREVDVDEDSSFCSAYLDACQGECQRVLSGTRDVICHRLPRLHYRLACRCGNGKMETQHALAAALYGNDDETSSSTASSSSATPSATVAPALRIL